MMKTKYWFLLNTVKFIVAILIIPIMLLSSFYIYARLKHSKCDGPNIVRISWIRRSILDYKILRGRWPEPTSLREQLFELSKDYSAVKALSEDMYWDEWNNPIIYKLVTGPDGEDIAIIYSMGKNEKDDNGNGDDLVVKIVNDKLVD